MNEMRTRTRLGLAAISAIAVTTVSLLATPAGETVASFADKEHTNGVFTSGRWNVQGNATVDIAEGWSDHFTAGGAAVFRPSVDTLVPGSTRSYSRFGLRMAPGSSTGATVTIPQGAESSAGKAEKFRMRVVRSDSSTCDLSSFGSGATFVVGDAATTYGDMKSFPNPGASTISLLSDGTPVFLCYEFSLPSLPITGLNNGDTAVVSWTFTAESS